MKIVFMGTPEFAVDALAELVASNHEVVAVLTQPDKPQGRKMVLTPPPTKVFAEAKGIPVYQPASVKTDESFELLKSFNADVFAVVAYGKILPQRVLDIPRYGCVNSHASILPRHRGASPIQYSIFCGDKTTGVTTQLMDSGIDTGDILLCEKTEILPTDNFESLHDKLKSISAKLLLKTINGLQNNEIIPVKQSDEGVSYAPIITKEMGLIDFSKTAQEIDCQIRAFSPWPSAYFFINGKRVKVIKAKLGKNSDFKAGTVVDLTDGIGVACGKNTSIIFTELQPEGKVKMQAKALLNGNPLSVGEML